MQRQTLRIPTQELVTGNSDGETGSLKHNSVGLLGTIGIAVGPQAPTGGINLLPAIMAGIVGASASLSFLLGLVAMVFVAYAFVIFSRRIASAGQSYSYASVAMGSGYGVTTGFVWLVAFFAVAGWLSVQDGNYLVSLFLPAGVHLPWLPMSIFMWALMVILSYRSVHVSAITVVLVEAFGLGLMLIVAIAVLVHGGYHGHGLSFKPFTTNHQSFNKIMLGVVFAFTSFSGFEAAGGLGEEATRPKWAIPLSIFSALLISGVIYVFMTWIETVAVASAGVLAKQTAPLVMISNRYIGSAMGTIMNIAALISGFGAQVACLVGGVRVLYALSRDGLSGRARTTMTRTHPKFGTPLMPFVVGSVGSLLSFLCFSGAGPLGTITDVSTYGADIEVIVYLLVVVAAIVFCWRWERKPIHFVVLIIGAVVMGYVVKDTLYPVPAYPLNWSMYAALFTLLVGTLVGTASPALRRRFAAARRAEHAQMLGSLEATTNGAS